MINFYCNLLFVQLARFDNTTLDNYSSKDLIQVTCMESYVTNHGDIIDEIKDKQEIEQNEIENNLTVVLPNKITIHKKIKAIKLKLILKRGQEKYRANRFLFILSAGVSLVCYSYLKGINIYRNCTRLKPRSRQVLYYHTEILNYEILALNEWVSRFFMVTKKMSG